MNILEKEINDILGYGKIFKVLVGRDDKGEPLIKEYHMTPVSIKDLPELFEAFDRYMETCSEQSKNYGREYAVKMIKMGLNKMHPDINDDEIEKVFGLVAIAEAIDVIVELNDFFSKIQKINMKVNQIVSESQVQQEKS